MCQIVFEHFYMPHLRLPLQQPYEADATIALLWGYGS